MGVQGAKELSGILKNNPYLTKLFLGYFFLIIFLETRGLIKKEYTHLGSLGTKYVSEGLQGNSSLTSLCLCLDILYYSIIIIQEIIVFKKKKKQRLMRLEIREPKAWVHISKQIQLWKNSFSVCCSYIRINWICG